MNCLAEARKGNGASFGVLLISEGPKATALAAEVPKDGALNAKEWVDSVLGALGGKGGGTQAKAQGTAPAGLAAKAATLAEAFLK